MTSVTDEHRLEAKRRLLAGLVRGDDAHGIAADVSDLHVRHNTFPGEIFMAVAADALRLADAAPNDHVAYRALLADHLPEVEFRGKDHRRIQYAVLTAFAVHGGLEPDLLDEVTYWIESYWQFALFAAVAIVRHCAERSGTSVESFATELARGDSIDIA